jgi:cellulose synthase (UDP-forming)
MTRSPLWREFESGDSFVVVLIRFLILFGGVLFLLCAGALELTWPQQLLLGLITILIAIWMDKSSTSYLVTLTLILVSMFSTYRYGYWRISKVYQFFFDPGVHWTWLDAFFILLLLGAETYAFVILFLGYVQTLWPLRRSPVPLPDDPENWPAVDLLIPTYNEPLSVVKFTALAAMNIDWPADKLNVYIVDDGKRDEFRHFAEEAGIGYMTREDNKHAKAGNINRALDRVDAPFVAIFDSDHVPTRSFLQVTMGWFLRDKKLGMLQTPHHFYSPDPFERNLGQFRVIPNEGELFYGIVQDGNDFWNATFFCGSCAVLRRAALDEIGGIAVETVTEDAHTSLRMQMKGWNTAYVNIPQAAGLATERLSGHVRQRIRWARGMVQILRIDNPLFAPGLTFWQRLCYFNAMSHFLYALPRLIFLSAPLIYLVFSHTNIPGYWAAILAYAFPHLIMSSLTNSRIQGQHRHSFWNEVYETVLAPYILIPTMLALISPKMGSFNVTAKGGVVNRSYFDARIALPFMFMLGFNFLGVLMAIPRFFYIPFPFLSGLYDGQHPGTIVMNLIWTFFNITMLGVATAVAWESKQQRTTVRVVMNVPADLVLADGMVVQGVTTDLSSGGVRLNLEHNFRAAPGDPIKLIFPVLDGDATLPATIITTEGKELRAQFDPLTLQEEEALTMVLYSRADTWLGWGESRDVDNPIKSLLRIFQLARRGLGLILRGNALPRKQSSPKGRLVTSIVPTLLLGVLLLCCGSACAAQIVVGSGTTPATAPVNAPGPGVTPMTATAAGAPVIDGGRSARPVAPGNFDNIFRLEDVGVADTIVLRGIDAYHSVYFSLPQTQTVKTATMHLKYHFSPGLLPSISHLKVSLNGTLFATIPVRQQPIPVITPEMTPEQKSAATQVMNETRGETNALLETDLALPAEMLVHQNELTFEFIGHYTFQCEDPSNSTLWSHIDADSTIEIAGSLIPLSNDLNMLPLPFYDASVNLHPRVPIVFMSDHPSPQALRAAGIVASYFGILTADHPVRFPVSLGGMIPAGNAIVIGENAAELPQALAVPSSVGPTLAMRTNPVDPYSKVLVVTGDSPDNLVAAAELLVLQTPTLQGAQVSGTIKAKPAARQPDDAPRWLSTDHVTTFGDIVESGNLQGDGSVPIGAYLRLPPDLYYGSRENLKLHMDYRYNGIPLANESSIQVYMNGSYVSSTPMPHTEDASSELSTVVPVPRGNMRPFSNSLMMKFVFQIARKGKCQDLYPLNLQGAILKSSYLDISGMSHWAALPDLELFANAGYPFTRKADLADTAVVLPEAATGNEIELYLTLMGHFGAQTGYPVLNVDVTDARGMRSGGKDYIVLGTVDDQPAVERLNDSLPVRVNGATGLRVQDTGGFFAPLEQAWWKVRSSDRSNSGTLETQGGMPDALLEGLEWPRNSGHSVVMIVLRADDVIPSFVTTFLRSSQSSAISQSVSVLHTDGQHHDDHFTSYRIGTELYHVGTLSPWVRVRLLFAQYPWLLPLGVILFCILMAILIRAILRRRARVRLQGSE